MPALGSQIPERLLWVAAIAVVVAGLAATVVLRVPQIRLLVAGFRAFRDEDRAAPGEIPPFGALVLSLCLSQGAAAVVAAATAVTLGGAGTIVYAWIGCLFLGALRGAEAYFGRTNPPGKAGDGAPTSLATRLGRDVPLLGYIAGVAVVLGALSFGGVVQGVALGELAEPIMPGSKLWVVGAAAAIVAVLHFVGSSRAATIVGWVGGIALVALVLACILTIGADPGRGLGALSAAIPDAWSGTAQIGAFSGAIAGEITRAGFLGLTPLFGAGATASSALHSAARARSTKHQVALAVIEPLFSAIVVTLVATALVSSDASVTRTDARRPLSELTIYRAVGFESASQRLESDRLFNGPVRIVRGQTRDLGVVFATDRATIDSPTFNYYGRAANLALQITNGKIERIHRPDDTLPPELRGSALKQIPSEQAAHVTVRGQMLPLPRTLVAHAVADGLLGPAGAQLMLVALFFIVVAGGFAWGMSAARSVHPSASRFVALAAAVGLGASLHPALAASGTSVAIATIVVLLAISLYAVVRHAGELGKATK